MIKVIRTQDYDDMSRKAANLITAQVALKPDSVLGLATGSSPLGIYQELIHQYENGGINFRDIRTVNLDEYRGLAEDHPQSYHYFMYENFFKHINIAVDSFFLPDGTSTDTDAECARYHKVIEHMGGIDLQLLGIGANGHIGFNEPSDDFADWCHCVKLTESTKKANARFFLNIDDVPQFAYTMGIGEIMSAKQILMVSSGKEKASAIRDMLQGPVTPRVPASILRFHHNVTLVADEDALSLL